jgi:signal transduction histidine kinase
VVIRDAEFARCLVSSMGSGLVAVDLDGRIVALSGGAQRLLGAGPELEDALGRPCRQVLSAQPGLARLLLDATGGREIPPRAELLLDGTPGGERRRIGFTVVPVSDELGGLRGAALLFRDLTPYERMDEQERLRERLAALGEMAAGMAHEIRNPLAGMEVLAGLLRRRVAGLSEEESLVDDLLGELRRVADTVTESLDFVKPIALSRVRLDPTGLLEECLAIATSRVPFEGEVVRCYSPAPGPLLADEAQLRAALTDLLVNALEAMKTASSRCDSRLSLSLAAEPAPAPVLRVGASRSEGPLWEPAGAASRYELVVSVTDNGPGVPADIADRIFHPFFTTKERGSGIGLANAQKAAASHGGSIELERGQLSGTTFRLRLPLEAEA